ncbi:unnamed protein product [Boreogadus saida]
MAPSKGRRDVPAVAFPGPLHCLGERRSFNVVISPMAPCGGGHAQGCRVPGPVTRGPARCRQSALHHQLDRLSVLC